MDRPGAPRLKGVVALLALSLAGGYTASDCWGSRPAVAMQQQPAPAAVRQPRLLANRLELPEVVFKGASDEPITLKRFSGKIVVLSVWATWCAPCIREMPSLDLLVTRVPGVAVIPVNVDAQGLNGAAAFYAKHSLRNLAPYYDSTGRVFGLLNGRGLPTSLIIDREGKVAAIVEGAVEWTSKEMLELLLRV